MILYLGTGVDFWPKKYNLDPLKVSASVATFLTNNEPFFNYTLDVNV